jgi:hypothetical protein
VRKPLYYYDFTSLYPDVGRMPLPCERPPRIVKETMSGEKLRAWLRGRMGFARVRVRTKKTEEIPLHPVVYNHRLCFPVIAKPREMLLWMPEVLAGWEVYEYEMVEYADFGDRGKKFMKEYFEDLFEFKKEAKRKGEAAKEKSWKIILNSGYGFWGYNRYDRDTVKISRKESRAWIDTLRKGKLKEYGVVGDYRHLRVSEDNMSVTNVSVAAAITSYARIKLWKLLRDIKRGGGNVYYCDTDSVVTDACLERDHREIWTRYNKAERDNGSEMGGLKNELGVGESFEGGIFVGCKMYSLTHKDPKKSENRLKGFCRREEELESRMLERLSEGEEIVQKFETLEIGKKDYVKEEGGFEIKVRQTEKKFRQAYSKGEKGAAEEAGWWVRPYEV